MTQPTEQPGSQPAGQPADAARWRGHTHKELYLLLHDGPGAAASAEPSRRWAELSTTLSEIGQDLRKALEKSGAAWSGRAAGAAYDRLSTTASWAAETGTDAAGMRTAVEDQAEHIARARADMPAPEDVPTTQPDPTVAAAVQVAAAQTDLEGPEATASSAEERAFEVMAAYELNTNTTTAALVTFEPPRDLVQRDEIHQGQPVGTQHTHSSVVAGWPPAQHHHDRPHWPGEHHGRGNGWGGWGTGGAAAQWTQPEVTRRPAAPPPAPAPAPGGFTGAAPLRSTNDERPRQRSGRGNTAAGPSSGSSGPSAGNASAPATRGGATSLGVPGSDLQAAAAGQAAVHQASTPMAPATGAPVAGGQDKMAMRRFGMEAIGSNQWFGDAEEPAVGQAPARRRDFREIAQVTESVSILGEEHKLPPTVIGDAPNR